MANRQSRPGFEDLDSAPDLGRFVNVLDSVASMELGERYKKDSYALMDIKPGHKLLDVGSGTGDDAIAMSSLVGNGSVVGLDQSEKMVTEANERARAGGLPVEFMVADAHAMKFDDGHFDGVRADRLLHHVASPGDVVKDMVRVLRPGGRIVIFEPDFETTTLHSPDRNSTRKILNFICDNLRRQGWAGRETRALLRAADAEELAALPVTFIVDDFESGSKFFMLTEGVTKMVDEGLISEGEGAEWIGQLQKLTKEGKFFCSTTCFLFCAVKPE